MAGDPVELKVVQSLARPGGNITGVTTLGVEVSPKRLEIIYELLPRRPTLLCWSIRRASIPKPFRKIRRRRRKFWDASFISSKPAPMTNLIVPSRVSRNCAAGGLVIGADPFFNGHAEELAALVLRHKVPTVYQYREFTPPAA